MPRPTPAGPFKVLKSINGQDLPYYIIPFDADGRCTGPLTKEHLIQTVAAGSYTDVFLFCHGWNNDWKTATSRYEGFINGVQALRHGRQLDAPAGYKPLLVGLFWPSQALAWFESETGPRFAAGGDPGAEIVAAGVEHDILLDVADAVPSTERDRFYTLASAPSLPPSEATELARLLAKLLKIDDEGGRGKPPSAEDLLAAARSLEEPDYDEIGSVGGTTSPTIPATPQAAGLGDFLHAIDPRNLIKPFTVWQMKDRAGVVGRHGASPLLVALLEKSQARVHLLGHSYGCKVVLTALCTPQQLPRPVESVLLFQPAISQYALAASVPYENEDHTPVRGGFSEAPKRTNRPIVLTYSANDAPLTKLFHLAVRRATDVGELQPASEGFTPSRYAAMGGFGAQASGARWIQILDTGDAYDFGQAPGVVAVNGTRLIAGHGDISNDATWWLSYLVAKP